MHFFLQTHTKAFTGLLLMFVMVGDTTMPLFRQNNQSWRVPWTADSKVSDQFLISRVWVRVLVVIIAVDALSFGWDVKPLVPCVV